MLRTHALSRGNISQRVRDGLPVFCQGAEFRSWTAVLDVGIAVGSDGERSDITTLVVAYTENSRRSWVTVNEGQEQEDAEPDGLHC